MLPQSSSKYFRNSHVDHSSFCHAFICRFSMVIGGVLLIVKNYSGDRINFALAESRARALGIKVKSVLVDDDCAIAEPLPTVGRRGLAGTIFIHKIAGCLADALCSLDTIHTEVLKVISNVATVGMCVTRCSVPGQTVTDAAASLGNEYELGLGIHGETGYAKRSACSAQELVCEMIHKIRTTSPLEFAKNSEIVLMVNNLGGTSQLELYIIVRDALAILKEQFEMKVKRILVGSFMTSLDCGGFSLTVVQLADPKWLDYINAPSNAPAWPNLDASYSSSIYENGLTKPLKLAFESDHIRHKGVPLMFQQKTVIDESTAALMYACISKACRKLISQKGHLNQLDRVTGDSDCGSAHARGAEAVLHCLSNNLKHSSLVHIFYDLSTAIEQHMGGTSGGLWSLFFSTVVHYLSSQEISTPPNISRILYESFLAGAKRIQEVGKAQLGFRTCLDSLLPALTAWKESLEPGEQLTSLRERVHSVNHACKKGSEATKSMIPRAGRSSYLTPEVVLKEGMPDPGAEAVSIVVDAICSVLLKDKK